MGCFVWQFWFFRYSTARHAWILHFWSCDFLCVYFFLHYLCPSWATFQAPFLTSFESLASALLGTWQRFIYLKARAKLRADLPRNSMAQKKKKLHRETAVRRAHPQLYGNPKERGSQRKLYGKLGLEKQRLGRCRAKRGMFGIQKKEPPLTEKSLPSATGTGQLQVGLRSSAVNSWKNWRSWNQFKDQCHKF